MTYSDFQNQNVSEKTVLAKVKASKRLIAWTLHSGSIYKIEDFDYPVIESIKDSATALTSVASLALVVAGSYFNDRENNIIYLRTSDSSNPNSKFLSMKFWNFYSNTGVSLSYDPSDSSTFDVYWAPILRSNSDFGNELDNEDQIGFSIEGSGQIVFLNDRNYWDSRFEKWVWDNQPVEIYSWERSLASTEAKLLYKGKIVGKSHSTSGVTFKLKDQLLALREPYPLEDLSDLAGALIPDQLLAAKQRRIYGRVAGFLPTNIDQVVDGYTLSGTISVTANSDVVTGSGTSFLDELSPEDEILLTIDGEVENFTIKSISSDTSLTLTEELGVSLSAQSLVIQPALPKKFINRTWLVAGHECSQPTRSVTDVFNLNRFSIDDVTDFREGDDIFVGSAGTGEFVTIQRISGNEIKLTTNLSGVVGVGTSVIRPCVQNLRWNNKKLIYDRDYTISFTGNRTYIVLDEEFEKNLRPIRSVNGTVEFANGSRSVTGTGTQFTKQLEPSGWIRSEGQFDFFEILSIESDTELTLRTAATYDETDEAQYLGGQNFNTETDFISCEVLGTTDDGDNDGALLKTGSKIVRHILDQVSITDINQDSFDKSHAIAPYTLGFVIPDQFSKTSVEKIRDIINKVNVSIFGSIVQNEDLELEFNILRPNKPPSSLVLKESDIISLNIESTNERVSKKAIVNYKNKEYDFMSGLSGPLMYEKISDTGTYLVESTQDRTVNSVLFYEDDARILANRWSFLLELGTNVLNIQTKLQATRLQVNDVVKVEHEKLFDRVGGGKVKYAAVQGIRKNGRGVSLELDDLSNMFNRVCMISETGSPDFDNSNLDQKTSNGFITDTYGLINNSEDTFGLNLIW